MIYILFLMGVAVIAGLAIILLKLTCINNDIGLLIYMANEAEAQLDAGLASLQTELDAAKARDEGVAAKLVEVQAALDDLKANSPDLADEIANVSAMVEEAKTIAQPPAPPPTP